MRSVQWVNNPLGRRDSNPWHHRTTLTGKNWDWTGDDDDGTHDDGGEDDDGTHDDDGSYPAKNPPSIFPLRANLS